MCCLYSISSCRLFNGASRVLKGKVINHIPSFVSTSMYHLLIVIFHSFIHGALFRCCDMYAFDVNILWDLKHRIVTVDVMKDMRMMMLTVYEEKSSTKTWLYYIYIYIYIYI